MILRFTDTTAAPRYPGALAQSERRRVLGSGGEGCAVAFAVALRARLARRTAQRVFKAEYLG